MAHNTLNPIALTGLTTQERVTIGEIVVRDFIATGEDLPDGTLGVTVTGIDLRLKDLVAFLERVGLEVYGEAWHDMATKPPVRYTRLI